MNRLQGARIVVTGAASGIGRALLPRLIVSGARHIAAVDRDAGALEAAIASVGGAFPIAPIAADLGSQAGCDGAFDAALRAMGGIDVYIANAGFAYYEVFSGDWERIDAIFRVNVYAPLYALGQMRRLHRDGSPYTVAITASAMARLAYPGYALYGATKAALDRFAEAYRYEMPPHETLTLIYPIGTRTAFFQRADAHTPSTWPTQTAEYVAARIVAGLKRGSRAVYPSLTFRILRALQPPLPLLYPATWLAARAFTRWRRQHERS
ncbi:MAG: SDR family NAD(P)-dependent oxidoreductase [Candidatus Flexifilum sp.]|jgi:short-subunit dehydrogenase